MTRRSGSELGRRVELVSMDKHHEDISIGLYVRDGANGPIATVHSYSRKPGTRERLLKVAEGLAELGGLEQLDNPLEVSFPCGVWHGTAARRLFLEVCKQDPAEGIEQRPLEAPDTRSEQTIVVEPLGDGAYEVHANGVAEGEQSRAPAIARGMAKLAQLDADEGERQIVRFPCGKPHDQLIGLLLARAQNLRQILREDEMQASRGVLAAPSAQE